MAWQLPPPFTHPYWPLPSTTHGVHPMRLLGRQQRSIIHPCQQSLLPSNHRHADSTKTTAESGILFLVYT